MEFKLDRSRKYALALEGGGAKGAYEIGAWEALQEEGLQLVAVSGTSVGAINGAFVAMDELELAKRLWCELTYSKVMDVDDSVMKKLMKGTISGSELWGTARSLKDVLLNGGFNVDPLLSLFDEYIDENRVRYSERDFYIITVSLTDRKELELRAGDLGEGQLNEMLLASAYLPVFKNVKLGGKRYVDGGFADQLPIHVLVENGYKDIIAVALNAIGVDRRFKIPQDVKVDYVTPTTYIGKILDFDTEQSAENLRIGYYDAKRMMYGLYGSRYYIDRTMSEKEAYERMCIVAMDYYRASGTGMTYKRMNEKVLPRLSATLKITGGDYYDLFVAALEAAADEAGIDRFRIYSDIELLYDTQKHFDIGDGVIPKSFFNFFSTMIQEWEVKHGEI